MSYANLGVCALDYYDRKSQAELSVRPFAGHLKGELSDNCPKM